MEQSSIITSSSKGNYPDFSNTQIAFANKSDDELKETERMFMLMNNAKLVSVGSVLGKIAIKSGLPFVQSIIKRTLFKHFCGGLNLADCQDVIDDLYKNQTQSLLDYGVEGKSAEPDLDDTLSEILNAIDFAAANHSVPAAICKLTGLVDNDVLIKKQADGDLDPETQKLYDTFYERILSACRRAYDLKVGLLIDAEESWMQDAMDEVVMDMMARFNKDQVIIYNTYQMYRKDTLDRLKADHKTGQEERFLIGAKLVRGAYMNKERQRAEEQGYPSPIHDTKLDTDRDFDSGIMFCLDHMDEIAFICASHNTYSNQVLAREVIDRGIDIDHPHVNFSQLQGMSDYITFNLAQHGFNVAKYVVYGPIKEVADFLIRRAEENTSITGEAGRELTLIRQELKRRGGQ
jgi:proline dehydrogenase